MNIWIDVIDSAENCAITAVLCFKWHTIQPIKQQIHIIDMLTGYMSILKPVMPTALGLHFTFKYRRKKKKPFRQLDSTKIQKPAQYCLLFHKFFPYSLPLCGLDWLCSTHCASIQAEPNRSPAQKHYPALWWEPGPAHPVHISYCRPTISSPVPVQSLWWASWQSGRITGHGVNV